MPHPILPTIGIVAGSSHAITGPFYDMVNEAVRRRLGGKEIAETLIAGMNYGRLVAMIEAGDWEGIEDYVSSKVDSLCAGGAELIVGTSNTMHEVMPKVMEGRGVPYLPITDPLCAAIEASGLERIALFGTMTTMSGGRVMQEVQERTGVAVLVPTDAEKEEISRVIYEELVESFFLPASKQRYLEIARRLAREDGAEGLILGCTEIVLLIDQPDLPEMKVFATARLQAEAAADWAVGRVA
ncbi:aspartate/glutamate racemase family protein [Parvularcula maris]|uniref:Amino acid racemase n=1 Tax=Parvularcula maris TaxID=2965077 RepID=A0A9X2RJ91_9PROT|nr:amino acid racemase [Parvularcula maris]MCQ8185701.1 amino acid racemase [Parvularcula maris]